MIKKICNHCGRVYVGECECRKKNRVYRPKEDSFYQSKAWTSMSRYIRSRDNYTDRLAMFLSISVLRGVQLHGQGILLARLLTLPDGAIRRFDGGVLVHHIYPRIERPELQLQEWNLITVSEFTHNYIHELYKTEAKAEVQALLLEAVKHPLA